MTLDNYLFPAFLVQFISAIAAAVIKSDRKSLFISQIILLAGLILGLVGTLSFGLSSTSGLSTNALTILNGFISIDGLGFFFLFIIQLVAIPTTIYNLSYLQHYINENKSIKNFILFYIMLLISTQLIVIANHAVLFLVCWEMMTITGYFAMILEKEKEEVQKGSFYYLVASHFLIFIIYIFFFLLHHQTGSWYFTDFQSATFDSSLINILFILSFIGFGIKAGFMPFHFWLPQAHPIAPTVLSAFLSGVIIKLGIYGILRTILFLHSTPEWFGWLVICVSIVSAIFGVWYALAQHDLKKLLAYHSIENIGIIGIGIGIGLIGSANNLPAIQVLGFGGALLHTLNHAIFKSLLFIGSGILTQNLGTRNIELMGGIVHRAKYLSLLFLIGSIAISGIPPLNGFISEFIIYNSFFLTAQELKNYYPLVMLLLVVGLAFVGGLAVACFTKINSIIFLGTERKDVKHFHVSIYDYISLSIFALLCITIGFYPQPFIGIVNKVLSAGFVNSKSSNVLTNMNWLSLTIIFITIVTGIILLYWLKLRIQKRYGRRVSKAWGCGYEDINPRMQYTASSFADELNTIPKSILVYNKKVKVSKNAFPIAASFVSHSEDFINNKIVIPLLGIFDSTISKMQFLSQTDIRYYIGFILLTIIVYSFIAFLWT